jgi:hypothetical protein
MGLTTSACGLELVVPRSESTHASDHEKSAGERNALKIPVKDAQTKLDGLPIKGRAPKTGYSREKFGGGWDTERGCDTRNRILRRDLVDVILDPKNCKVMQGILYDPYTNVEKDRRIEFVRGAETSDDVQIDHVVSLSDAWQKGAQEWYKDDPDKAEGRRIQFANDPLDLWAVSGVLNQRKGDADAATWLPPNKDIRCSFVTKQILVKEEYDLWVTQAEHDAMERELDGCKGDTIEVVR